MKNRSILLLLLLTAMSACDRNEPDPDPLPIRAYCTFYNFLMTSPVTWEVDGVELPDPIPYGSRFLGAVILDGESEEIPFISKIASSGEVLESQLVQLSRDAFYQIVLLGTVDEPVVVVHQEVISRAGADKIRFQFMHVAADLDSLDVYMGGTAPENKVLSAIGYSQISDYFEAEDYKARASTTITMTGDSFEPDSVLIDYQYNDPLHSESNYLVVIGHETNQVTSDLRLFLFPHPAQ